MTTLRFLRLRSSIAILLLLSFLVLLTDQQAIGVEGSDTVTVTAQIEAAPPECADTATDLSFLPSVQYSSGLNPVYIQLPDSTSDFAYVDLNIQDGLTEDCDTITGYVSFSESGFEDSASGDAATFLSSVFECDSSALTADGMEVYTCGQSGISPLTITMTVEASEDAVDGYYDNTISIDLIANP